MIKKHKIYLGVDIDEKNNIGVIAQRIDGVISFKTFTLPKRKFRIGTCRSCGYCVSENWYLRHLRSKCKKGIKFC